MPTCLPVLLYVFSVLFSLERLTGDILTLLRVRPLAAAASGLVPVASQVTGQQAAAGLSRGCCMGSSYSRYPSLVTEPFQAVLSPPCPGQHQRSPLPAALAHQGGIKSREVNGGWGRVQSGRAWESP